MTDVKVYSTPTCPWCTKAKKFLSEHKIEFEDINVAADASARDDMIKKSGQMGVPVLDIDGQIILGFDVAKIRTALNISG